MADAKDEVVEMMMLAEQQFNESFDKAMALMRNVEHDLMNSNIGSALNPAETAKKHIDNALTAGAIHVALDGLLKDLEQEVQ